MELHNLRYFAAEFLLSTEIQPPHICPAALAKARLSDSGNPLDRLVADSELSPLDLAIAPNGNIVVFSERPFGAVDAVTRVREYDARDGNLVRVFSPNGKAEFDKPRGLRFAPNGVLYCAALDEVVGFDFASGECLGAIARLPGLNGQALVLFPC